MTHTQSERVQCQPKYLCISQPLGWDRGTSETSSWGHCDRGRLHISPRCKKAIWAEELLLLVGSLLAICLGSWGGFSTETSLWELHWEKEEKVWAFKPDQFYHFNWALPRVCPHLRGSVSSFVKWGYESLSPRVVVKTKYRRHSVQSSSPSFSYHKDPRQN